MFYFNSWFSTFAIRPNINFTTIRYISSYCSILASLYILNIQFFEIIHCIIIISNFFILNCSSRSPTSLSCST